MADTVRWYLKTQGDRFSLAGWVASAALAVFAIRHVVIVLSFSAAAYLTMATVMENKPDTHPTVVYSGKDGQDYTVKLEHRLSQAHYKIGTSLPILVKNDQPWVVLENTFEVKWLPAIRFFVWALVAAFAAFGLNAGTKRIRQLERAELDA